MNRQDRLRRYDRIMAVVVTAIVLTMLLASCATQRGMGYQDHLRSAPTQNWVRHDNGGCGWHN
jgi:predicted small secreted protein